MTFLYHYTDHAGATGILRDRRINISTKATDAFFGEGVYLTRMPPAFGQQRIIANNYDSASRLWNNPRLHRRADYYFKMDIGFLAAVSKLPIKRDVWLYPGPIIFQQVPWDFGPTPKSINQFQQWTSWPYDGPRVSWVAPQCYRDRTVVPARNWQC